MVRVWSTSRMAICTKGNTVKVGSMVWDNSFGKMVNTIRDTSGMACGMGMGSGRVELVRMTSTKGNSRIIRRTGMGFILGSVATSTRGTTRTTCVADTGKCTGMTAASIEDNGSSINRMEMAKDSMEHNLFKQDSS